MTASEVRLGEGASASMTAHAGSGICVHAREAAMSAKQQVKELVKDAFPSIWLQWHFMKRPKSAERELSYLDKVIPDDAVTVDVGANCGLYTRRAGAPFQAGSCLRAFAADGEAAAPNLGAECERPRDRVVGS